MLRGYWLHLGRREGVKLKETRGRLRGCLDSHLIWLTVTPVGHFIIIQWSVYACDMWILLHVCYCSTQKLIIKKGNAIPRNLVQLTLPKRLPQCLPPRPKIAHLFFNYILPWVSWLLQSQCLEREETKWNTVRVTTLPFSGEQAGGSSDVPIPFKCCLY